MSVTTTDLGFVADCYVPIVEIKSMPDPAYLITFLPLYLPQTQPQHVAPTGSSDHLFFDRQNFPSPHIHLSTCLPQPLLLLLLLLLPFPIPLPFTLPLYIGYHSWHDLSAPTVRSPPRFPWALRPPPLAPLQPCLIEQTSTIDLRSAQWDTTTCLMPMHMDTPLLPHNFIRCLCHPCPVWGFMRPFFCNILQ